MKILSPAGNFECLKMAVYNGADEVYLGINNFNARNNIDGFNFDNLKEAVDFAHVFNVKVNLAINILFSDEELQNALDTIISAYNLGVDCFIIQDIGLANLVSKNYPQIEIHASTQMGIHNFEGIKAIEKFGFKRVVLARETPLEEIKRIRENSNIELEYFAQGALCVSFSGNCYLSSYLNNASGNRGKCKQLCRLPYTFLKNGKPIKTGYLLSAKDFNLIEKLDDLEKAGIDVIKIEGRARRPYYVATATKEYYNAINGKKANQDNLKLAFNRTYTPGYFEGNGNIISDIQNHIGIKIGEVKNFKKGRTFNEIFISSSIPLSPKSTFKFFSKNKEQTTLTAYDLKPTNNLYRLTSTQSVNVGDSVHLIIDAKKEETTLSQINKKDISIDLFATINQPIKAFFTIDNKSYSVMGDICEKANNQPITKIQLIENFSKSDLFNAKINIKELDNVFIPKQKLNEFRRNVFTIIFNKLTDTNRNPLNKIEICSYYNVIKFDNFQIIQDLTEKFTASNIIYSPSQYSLDDIKTFQSKCTKEKRTAYLDTPNFALAEDIKLLKDIIAKTGINIIANNYYALTFDTNIVIGAGLNVYNRLSAQVFNKPIITAESNISTRINYPYMTLRHCPLKSHLNANCANCPYNNNYVYKMENGKILKLKRKKLASCTFYLTD